MTVELNCKYIEHGHRISIRMNLPTKVISKLRSGGVSGLCSSGIRVIKNRHQSISKSRIDPTKSRLKHRYQYGGAAPNTDRLIYVDTNDVEFLTTPHFWKFRSVFQTHIEPGDWDQLKTDKSVILSGRHEGMKNRSAIPFENYQFYLSAKRRYGQEIPWEDTKLYTDLTAHANQYWSKYNSVAAIEHSLANLDKLYYQIANEGYQSQDQLEDQDTTIPAKLHEVAINIGREGELLFDDGRHRFVIAKVLGLEKIPVRVFVRHEKWQEKRREVAKADSKADLDSNLRQYIDHPDMQDVLP